MDSEQYRNTKEKIDEARRDIIDALTDINIVVGKDVIERIDADLRKIEAFSVTIGGYFSEAMYEEKIKKLHCELLDKQCKSVEVSISNDNKRTELQEKQIALQEHMTTNYENDMEKRNANYENEIKLETRMVTALESIAYSLAKMCVFKPDYVFADNDWKGNPVECKSGE